jgi:site-specific recombinase XerD
MAERWFVKLMELSKEPEPLSPGMLSQLQDFGSYLLAERGYSPRTKAEYAADLTLFGRYLLREGRGGGGFDGVQLGDLRTFLAQTQH